MADKKISALTASTTPLAGTEVLPIVQSGSTVKVSVANLTAGRAVNTGNLTVGGTFDLTADVEGLITYGRFAAGYPWVLIRPNSTATGIEFRSNAGDAQLTITQANGNVGVSQGNLVIGTAGKGIDFSANTHAAGMTSELLNDYEEGTWTPVVADAATGGNVAGGTYSGTYTKIGRNVFVTYCLDGVTTAGMTAGNDLFMRSLPFAANSTASQVNYGCVDVRFVTITAPPISFLSASLTYLRFIMPASASGFVGLKVSAINSGNSAIFGSFSYQTN